MKTFSYSYTHVEEWLVSRHRLLYQPGKQKVHRWLDRNQSFSAVSSGDCC